MITQSNITYKRAQYQTRKLHDKQPDGKQCSARNKTDKMNTYLVLVYVINRKQLGEVNKTEAGKRPWQSLWTSSRNPFHPVPPT